MTMQEKVQQQLKAVTGRSWLDYARTFGRDTQELMTDAVTALVIALNEVHRKQHGRGNVEALLDMSLEQLEEKLREAYADEPDAGAATFRDGGAGGEIGGGVDADGPGAGVRAEPGAGVPVDGDPAV